MPDTGESLFYLIFQWQRPPIRFLYLYFIKIDSLLICLASFSIFTEKLAFVITAKRNPLLDLDFK